MLHPVMRAAFNTVVRFNTFSTAASPYEEMAAAAHVLHATSLRVELWHLCVGLRSYIVAASQSI